MQVELNHIASREARGVLRTTENRFALPIFTPFARPGDFPRGCGGRAGVPNCGNNVPIDRVTKVFHCVKVHLESAPACFWFAGTLLHWAIFCKRGLPEPTLV